MKIYLAGPMTGIRRQNHDAFDAAAAALRARGHDVANPAEFDRSRGLDPELGDLTTAHLRLAMEHDTKAICQADAIALLPGWERSRGVAVELSLARCLGLTILDAHTGDPNE